MVGILFGFLCVSLKNESLVEVMVVKILAMMVLVFIVIDMDDEVFFIIKIGDFKGSF